MNKERKKLSFFQKTILAITDFRFYPLMLKLDSLMKCIGHFVVFMIAITMIMTISFFGITMDGIDTLLARYDEKIPEFYLENGVLNVDTREVYKVLNDLVVIINTDHKYDEISKIDDYDEYDRYNNRIYINSDAITYESKLGYEYSAVEENVQVTQLLFNEISDEYNKASLNEYIQNLRNTTKIKIFIFVSLFMMTFSIYMFTKCFEVFLYSIMASLVATISGMKLSFKNYVKIALYIITLPYILETISVVYLGNISESTFIISNIVAYIYILYAVRAVKLDALILIMNNPTKIKKSKDGRTVVSIDKSEKQDTNTSENDQDKNEESESENKKTNDEDNMQN